MPIRLPEPPTGVLAVLNEELGVLAGLGSRTSLRSMATPGARSVTLPHRVFMLGLDEIRTGALSAARFVGWRYLVEVDGRVVAAAQLTPDGDRLVHVNEGPFVQATVDAMTVAHAAVGDEDGDVELRLLHVPGLYIAGLWLHGDGDDRVVPLTPAAQGLELSRAYPAAELLEILAATPPG